MFIINHVALCELGEGPQSDSVGYLQIVRALQPLLGCLGNLVGPGMKKVKKCCLIRVKLSLSFIYTMHERKKNYRGQKINQLFDNQIII